MSDLERERDAVIGICVGAAETQERMLKMFPQNAQYKEYAQMARWVAAEVEKRRGIVFDEDGSEVEGEAFASLNRALLEGQFENAELKGLLAGMRVERDRLEGLVKAHEGNAALVMTAHNKALDESKEKDRLIGQLADGEKLLVARLEESMAAMEAEREAIREHERGLCSEKIMRMAMETPEYHVSMMLRKAAELVRGRK
jgi:hypothetical protein